MTPTTEEKNKEYRKRLTFHGSSDTIKRRGWYYTEKCKVWEYPICLA